MNFVARSRSAPRQKAHESFGLKRSETTSLVSTVQVKSRCRGTSGTAVGPHAVIWVVRRQSLPVGPSQASDSASAITHAAGAALTPAPQAG